VSGDLLHVECDGIRRILRSVGHKHSMLWCGRTLDSLNSEGFPGVYAVLQP